MVNPTSNLTIPADRIEAFCQHWNVRELLLFGSVLREDFTPQSDVDVLVSFKPNISVKFTDLLDMEAELSLILGRTVDLGTRKSVEADPNYLRRQEILESTQVLYAE